MIANNPEYSQMEAQEIYLIHNFFCLSVEREFSSISDEGMKCLGSVEHAWRIQHAWHLLYC